MIFFYKKVDTHTFVSVHFYLTGAVVGGFFYPIARMDRENDYGTAGSARTGLWASVLVLLAALLWLGGLLKSAAKTGPA